MTLVMTMVLHAGFKIQGAGGVSRPEVKSIKVLVVIIISTTCTNGPSHRNLYQISLLRDHMLEVHNQHLSRAITSNQVMTITPHPSWPCIFPS